jgi:hypothetical protein
MLVRLKPHGNRQHYQRGKIVRVMGDKAEVQIFRHRGTEVLAVSDLSRWKSKDAENEKHMARTGNFVIYLEKENGQRWYYRNSTTGFRPGLADARRYERTGIFKALGRIAQSNPQAQHQELEEGQDVGQPDRRTAYIIAEKQRWQVWNHKRRTWTDALSQATIYKGFGGACHGVGFVRNRMRDRPDWRIDPNTVVPMEPNQYLAERDAARGYPPPATIAPPAATAPVVEPAQEPAQPTGSKPLMELAEAAMAMDEATIKVVLARQAVAEAERRYAEAKQRLDAAVAAAR